MLINGLKPNDLQLPQFYIFVKAYLDWICVLKSCRHQGAAQKLLSTLRDTLKQLGVDTLIGLTASNDEAQRFYKAVTDSEMRDIGIWIDIK